ncbi:MAG: PIG-L family deacetylase [Rubricoccaceae bacterium]|nr:PIG-L family deacetylase [Rubricoccaceae bacterium]
MPLPTRLLALSALLALPLAAPAQDGAPRALVVMNLAAHPDDEDGATLAYYRHHEGALAPSVIFTRGEGGQNEAGPDLYERLGAIRTVETEQAARILGTQVHFLNFYDFGFSKHAAETYREWSRPRRGFWDAEGPPISEAAGRDTVTARLVHLIRTLKPDVLFTNHDTTTVWPRAQHGHHQVVGLSAWEAFEKAADPAYHPEQLAEEGVDLWQPSRLFVRQFRPDGTHDVAVPVSDPCPTSRTLQDTPGCSDLAVEAAAQHVSQGFDKFADRFRRDTTYFVLYRRADGVPPLPDGATDLAAGLPERPEALRLPTRYLLDSGRLAPYPGLQVGETVAVPGQAVTVTWPEDPRTRGGRLAISLGDGSVDAPLRDGSLVLRVPDAAAPTAPRHRYQYDRFLSRPPIHYTVSEPGGSAARTRYGGYLPLEVVPPVVVDLDPAPVRLVAGDNAVPVAVRTHDPAADAVRLTLEVTDGSGAVVATDAATLAPADTAAVLHARLAEGAAPGAYAVRVTAEATPTSAPADPYRVTRPAAVLPDVRVAEGLRVGFVRSYDRVTEDALRAMGAEVVVLDSTALAAGAFDGLDTVVLDIRAYLVRPDLRAHNDRLLDWVRDGGHLVVGYHKLFEWNAGGNTGGFFDTLVEVPEGGWAPYPLRLGRDRVTMEDAPVELLAPGHAVFRAPHAIAAADWDGWVQERGLYFPSEYDARYQELVGVGDAGEAPLRGGLLLAEAGEGTYLYSPLVFYRQLEALNPGAWRLFANLVSLPLVEEGGMGG